jgi:hypothetical protein
MGVAYIACAPCGGTGVLVDWTEVEKEREKEWFLR